MADKIFLDTNVLVYAEANDPTWGLIAQQKITYFEQQGFEIWINRQVIREFLVVISRKMHDTANYNAQVLTQRIQAFHRQYYIADENEVVTQELLKLIDKYQIVGKAIHDCNIIATIKTYQINNFITHNTADFQRYSKEGFNVISLTS